MKKCEVNETYEKDRKNADEYKLQKKMRKQIRYRTLCITMAKATKIAV